MARRLIAPEGDEDHALTDLVGADSSASLESTLDGSTSMGRGAPAHRDGDLSLGTLPSGDQLTDRVLQATVAVAVRRDLPGLGLTDVSRTAADQPCESLFQASKESESC